MSPADSEKGIRLAQGVKMSRIKETKDEVTAKSQIVFALDKGKV